MSTTIFDTLNFPTTDFFDGICTWSPTQPSTYACWAPGVQAGMPPWPWIAASFSTPATSPVVLSRVGIKLGAWDTTLNGTTAVSLVANDPTAPGGYTGTTGIGPGGILVDLGSVSDTALLLKPNSENFYFYSNYVLTPSTRYWIGLRDISPPGSICGSILGYVTWTVVATSVGVAGEYFYNNGTSPSNNAPSGYYGVFANNIQGPYQMQIDIN